MPEITTTEPVEDPEKQLEIHNLTAEIESFVKQSNDDSATVVPSATSTPIKTKDEEKCDEIIVEEIVEEKVEEKTPEIIIGETEKMKQGRKVDIITTIVTLVDHGKEKTMNEKDKDVEIVTVDVNQKISEKPKDELNKELKTTEVFEENKVQQKPNVNDVEMVEVLESRQESVIVEKKIIQKQEVRIVNLPSDHEDDDIEQIMLPSKPLKPEPTPRHEKYPAVAIVDRKPEHLRKKPSPSLRISESLESLTEKDLEDSLSHPKTIKTDNYEFEVRFVPLRSSSSQSRHQTWSNENALQRRNSNDDVSPSPEIGGRRKSVKEIIESINKSQSLLKVNHNESTSGLETNNNLKPSSDEILAITESTDSLTRNLNSLIEDEKKINNFLAERASISSSDFNKNNDELNNNLDDNGVFEKCELRKKDGLDWNPLPKPRRSRNFSDEYKNQA